MNNILKKATRNTNRKELAAALGITINQVGRQINNEVKSTALDKIKIYMDHTDNDLIIQHLAETAGGYFFREAASSKDCALAEIFKEFSEFVGVTSEAYLDGKITKAELFRMKAEWTDTVGAVQGMFKAIEKELLK